MILALQSGYVVCVSTTNAGIGGFLTIYTLVLLREITAPNNGDD